jgi:hypothetical protein
MKRILIIMLVFLAYGCQTIENKSQDLINKENEKLSKFLQKPESELKVEMGLPDKIIHGETGTRFLVYIKKKYNITCERKFEIDKKEIVVGFSSKGCF